LNVQNDLKKWLSKKDKEQCYWVTQQIDDGKLRLDISRCLKGFDTDYSYSVKVITGVMGQSNFIEEYIKLKSRWSSEKSTRKKGKALQQQYKEEIKLELDKDVLCELKALQQSAGHDSLSETIESIVSKQFDQHVNDEYNARTAKEQLKRTSSSFVTKLTHMNTKTELRKAKSSLEKLEFQYEEKSKLLDTYMSKIVSFTKLMEPVIEKLKL